MNSASDGALVMEGSNLFHSLIDRGKKDCLKQSLLEEYSLIVYACLCRSVRDSAKDMYLDASIRLWLCRMWCRNLRRAIFALVARVGRPEVSKRCVGESVRLYLLCINLMAFL